MTETQMEETLDQNEHPVVVEREAKPSPTPLPKQMTPLEVVQDYVAAMNSDTIHQKLANVYILSFFGHHPQHYQHEGFEKAAYIDRVKAEILKLRLKCAWMRQGKVQEELSGRCPDRHPAASQDLDQLRFLETRGTLNSIYVKNSEGDLYLGKPIMVGLTLGYRQVPLASGHGRNIEICLAAYEVTPPPFLRKCLFLTQEKEHQPALELTQAKLETINEEAVAQPSASEEPPAHRYSLRKRHYTPKVVEVEPKRKVVRHR